MIKFKRLHPDARIPSYAHPGDAGLDLYASDNYEIEPLGLVPISTGVATEIPDGYVGLIWDKSGLAIKNGLKVMGGVIDSGYRGEIVVGLANLSKEKFIMNKGEKVAQLIIQKVESAEVEIADNLPESERGKKGFGSSGRK